MAYLLSIVVALVFMQYSCEATNLKWVKAYYGGLPAYAVAGGEDYPGEVLYVARVSLKSGATPGKFDVSARKAHAPWGGREHSRNTYEVLTNPGWKSYLKWVKSSGNIPPANAVVGGYDNGRRLYVARFLHKDGHMIPGKAAYFYRKAYVPFNGKEYEVKEWYVLVEEKHVHFNRKRGIYPELEDTESMKRAPIRLY